MTDDDYKKYWGTALLVTLTLWMATMMMLGNWHDALIRAIENK